jgi:hypothetical protein
MVFTNSIMTTHVNRIANGPPMSLITIRGYKSRNVGNPRGGYQDASVITIGIPNHRNGHSMRPNKVAFKYPNFKKDVDPDTHVRMFNSIMKANVGTSEEYIINVLNYTLKDILID